MKPGTEHRRLQNARLPVEEKLRIQRLLACHFKEDAAGEDFLQLRHRTMGHQTSGVHERDAVAAFGLVEIMRGDDEGDALARHLIDQRPEAAARNGIDPARGFVEEDHARSMKDRAGEGEPLLPASRQRARDQVFLAKKARGVNRPGLAFSHGHAGQAVDAAEETQVLNDGQIVIQAEALGHVADPAFQRLGVFGDVDAENTRAAGRGSEKAAEHADGRRLPSTVRSEEAEDFAFADAERQIVHRRERAEAFDEVLDLDDGGTARRLICGERHHHVIDRPPG